MNERIKQLAVDAGIGFTLWDDSGREMIDNYTPEERLAKFAELIVKECAGIVDDKIEVSRYVHEAELLRECSTTIKLHFGVEE